MVDLGKQLAEGGLVDVLRDEIAAHGVEGKKRVRRAGTRPEGGGRARPVDSDDTE